jgi:predicted transcriptional regulator
MSDQVSVRLTPELRRELERVAELERRTISNLVRNVLEDFAGVRKDTGGERRAA